MARMREIYCKTCKQVSYAQPDLMSTFCLRGECDEDDMDNLEDRGVVETSTPDPEWMPFGSP